MAINYSLVKLASKFGDKAGVPKFYARAQMNESISLKKFAKLIAMQTTVSYADVTAVLISLQENMVIELQRGNQIDFGELGKFRLQLTSEGAATAAEFKSDINIKGVNIQFIPGSDLSKEQTCKHGKQILKCKRNHRYRNLDKCTCRNQRCKKAAIDQTLCLCHFCKPPYVLWFTILK